MELISNSHCWVYFTAIFPLSCLNMLNFIESVFLVASKVVGSNNYGTWKIKVQSHLHSQKVWDVVMPIGPTPTQRLLSLIVHEAFSSTSQGAIAPSRPRVFFGTYHYIIVKNTSTVGSTIIGINAIRNMATKNIVTTNAATNK